MVARERSLAAATAPAALSVLSPHGLLLRLFTLLGGEILIYVALSVPRSFGWVTFDAPPLAVRCPPSSASSSLR